jgi:hypothetical protein
MPGNLFLQIGKIINAFGSCKEAADPAQHYDVGSCLFFSFEISASCWALKNRRAIQEDRVAYCYVTKLSC